MKERFATKNTKIRFESESDRTADKSNAELSYAATRDELCVGSKSKSCELRRVSIKAAKISAKERKEANPNASISTKRNVRMSDTKTAVNVDTEWESCVIVPRANLK